MLLFRDLYVGHPWCLESVVKAFGTTVKKALKKKVEAGVLEIGGYMWC
jgi:hypothetical protein